MNSARVRSLARAANEASGAAFRSDRIDCGASQTQEARRCGKNHNSHVSRLEKRGAKFGDAALSCHMLGRPNRMYQMARAALEAVADEAIEAFKHLGKDELRKLVKAQLDGGCPNEAYRPALALTHRAQREDDLDTLAAAYGLLGNIYCELGERGEGLLCYALCGGLDGKVADRTWILRSMLNAADAYVDLGAIGPAYALLVDLEGEPLNLQDKGFWFRLRGRVAELRGRSWHAWRCFLVAQSIFMRIPNDAYAAWDELQALRILSLNSKNEETHRISKERILGLTSHPANDVRGLAYALKYELYGDAEDLREAERIAADHDLATVEQAIARARRCRTRLRLMRGAKVLLGLLLSLLPLLVLAGNAVAQKSS